MGLERKNNIKSLTSALKESVNRVIEVIKGALNGEIGTIIEHPEKIKQAVETVEKNTR